MRGKLAAWKTEFNRENYRKLLLCFLAALGLNLLSEVLARQSLLEALSFFVGDPWVFLYGTLILFFTLSLSLLFRKRRFYFFLFALIWPGFAFVDFLLLTFRSVPLTASDIRLLAATRDVFDKYLNYVQLFFLILAISAAIGFLLLLWTRSRKFPSIFGFAAVHTLLIGLLLAGATAFLLQIGVLDDHTEFSNLPRAYRNNGFAYGFSASVLTGGIAQPDEYSPSEVEDILDTQRDLPPTASDNPNIILVQLESFFDPSCLNDVIPSENPVPNFQALREQGSHGLLSVPAIGGGTANTEFEVLTGMNLSHFGVGEYPYVSAVNSRAAESLAFALADLGYCTHAIHNNNATFYDRHLVYANLGFQTFTPLEYMDGVTYNPDGWAKDSVLTGEILKALEATDGSDFVFAVSVQPHGKYPTAPLPGAPTISVQGVEDESRKNGIEYYLGQLRECDAFLADLTQALSQFDEPTVVVFYGDHQPSLNILQEELRYGDTQSTEYVLWANYDMERETRDLQTYQLAAYVLDRCGIHEGTLFRLHQSYNYASEQNQPYQDDLEILEYDVLYGKHYSEGAPPAPVKMRYDVEDCSVTAVEAAEETLTVRGTHFTPYSTVFVNHTACATEFISATELRAEGAMLSEENTLTVAQISADDGLTVLSETDNFLFRP